MMSFQARLIGDFPYRSCLTVRHAFVSLVMSSREQDHAPNVYLFMFTNPSKRKLLLLIESLT